MRLLTSIAFLLPSVLASGLAAQNQSAAAGIPEDPITFQKLVIPGRTTFKRTGRLLDRLTWHKTLDRTVKAANKADRPIVFIQALGKLRGPC